VGGKYPAIIKLWANTWTKFIPFLDCDVEIRRVICSTNLSRASTRGTAARSRTGGHCPTDQAAPKLPTS
jgi:transposase-like protein